MVLFYLANAFLSVGQLDDATRTTDQLDALDPGSAQVRFLREGTIIWKGSIQSLKRFKDDAREVREGFECGIGLSDFTDLKGGDLIETYEEREIARV